MCTIFHFKYLCKFLYCDNFFKLYMFIKLYSVHIFFLYKMLFMIIYSLRIILYLPFYITRYLIFVRLSYLFKYLMFTVLIILCIPMQHQ